MTEVLHNCTDGNPTELTLEESDNIKMLDKKIEDNCIEKNEINILSDTIAEPVKTTSEEITRPVRPMKGPPPVLTAKPNAVLRKPIPPRPPQLSSIAGSPTKLPSQVNNPKSISKKHCSYSGSNDQTTIPKPKYENQKPNQRTSDLLIPRHEEDRENDPKISNTKSKPKETTVSIENENLKVPDILTKQNTKEDAILVIEKPLQPVESRPAPAAKSESIANIEPGFKDSINFKDDIYELQLKVSKLQKENAEVRKEISDLEKSFTTQIDLMNEKIEKLINEFEEEKAIWAKNEIER